MSSSLAPSADAAWTAPFDADTPEFWPPPGDAAAADAGLAHELARSHRQLALVLAINGRLARLQDPEVIQSALLRYYGALLHAGAVFLESDGDCIDVWRNHTPNLRVELLPWQIRATLARFIERVRRTRRPISFQCVPTLDDTRVLINALPTVAGDPGIVIALRQPDQPRFGRADVLASESMLVHGAQVLRNASMLRDVQQSALETVCALVNAIDAKDNYTSNHSQRVGRFARLTGEALGLARERLQALEWAGQLHDVGKIGIAEHILNKPGRLTPAEFEQMKNHPRIGYEMLRPVARFQPVLSTVLYHHENYDGSGYPEGLHGPEIPLEARIIHVVDVFDALTTRRPSRDAYDLSHALHILRRGSGRITDPHVTACFIDLVRRIADDPETFAEHFPHLLPLRIVN